MEENNWNWLIWLIVLFLIFSWWKPKFLQTKYEGMTAEEWFNEADEWEAKFLELRDCVENYDTHDEETRASTLVSDECAY